MVRSTAIPNSTLLGANLQSVRPAFPPLISPAGVAFPRGRLSEIIGDPSSGRTTLLFTALATATRDGEVCALVDTGNMFDPTSASAAGVVLSKLLWIRCNNDPEHAMRVTDLLLQANGFGAVAIDLGDTAANLLRRIPLHYWYRFRRAVEPTRTAVMVVTPEPVVRQCATLSIEARRTGVNWSGAVDCSRLLDGVDLHFEPRKPPNAAAGRVSAICKRA